MADDPVAVGTLRRGGSRSIASFLTDGSVIRLCETIGAIAGVTVCLIDPKGVHLANPDGDIPPGLDEPWVRRAAPPGVADSRVRAPIVLNGEKLGEFVAVPPADIGAEDQARHRVLVSLLAGIASEFCEEADAMRNRIRELGALFRLNSLLVRTADDLDRLLSSALELALGALELDAGSVVLFQEDTDGVPDTDSEAGVRTHASINLSDDWLRNSLPLSRGRAFDRLVLSGTALAIADLRRDPRVLAPERLEEEGLRAFLSAALVHRDQPIGVVRLYGRDPRVFSMADRRLIRSIAEQSAIAVTQARLLRIARREREIERQLTLASAVQRRMQSSEHPVFPGVDAAAKSNPSSMVGGDIYDLFARETGDGTGSLGMVIGDVVGKGLPAALLMSAVRASLRAHANAPGSLEDAISRANRDMCRDSMPNEFTTLWYAALDPESLELTYCSAGHDPPFIIRPDPDAPQGLGRVISLETGGLVIGVNPAERYTSQRERLQPGDVLVAYTDGLTDARSFDDEKFGYARLVEAAVDAVAALPDERASVVLDQILWTLHRFTGLRSQIDDETLIVVRIAEETG